jgi:RNA polymerase sigma-70 factor (ECF subfamily)
MAVADCAACLPSVTYHVMARDTPSDQTRNSLLIKVSTGDGASWTEFVELYEPLLTSYALKQGLARHNACDVVQDTFIRLLRAMPRFKLNPESGRFRTWLWRVTSSALVDWARRGKGQSKAEEAVRERWRGQDNMAVEPEPEWDEDFRQRILDQALVETRKTTQEKTWRCFEEHVLKERPSAEVGAELGLTANSVNVNSSRVLGRVRELCQYYQEKGEA